MNTSRTLASLVVASAALLSGCASNSSQPYDSGSSTGYNSSANMGYGTIDSIQVTRASGQTSGAGAVIGGLVGAVAGNQIGSGTGRTAATVAGAVGGAAIGNSVESKRNQNGQEMYQISVRMDNGDYRNVVQDSVYDLRVGNRVRIVDGRVYRY